MKYDLRKRIISAMPLISLFLFLLIGFIGNQLGKSWWHPGWLVFLLIPIAPFLLGLKKIHITYPIIVAIIYLILGLVFGLWHPGWIIFITIPIVSIIFPTRKNND